MRILLKLTLDCPPDAAWDAIRSPQMLSEVSAPLMTFESLEKDGFPELWSEGEHPCAVKAFGRFAVGRQNITINFWEQGATRVMRDDGGPISGPLTVINEWDHRLAVTPTRKGNKTLYRDQLSYEAGAMTLIMWPFLWVFWQWRAIGLRRFASTWAK